MIKVITPVLAAIALAVASSASYAADNAVTAISSGTFIENTTAGCSILADRVTVNTSTGVTLVYNCITASSKVNLGGCHATGSQKPGTFTCTAIGTAADGTTPVFNNAACTAAGQLTDPRQTFVVAAGRRGFTGSTTGGSVGVTSLAAATCDVGTLGALDGVRL